ncbi:hypothetical protein [Maridesulfovibrio sp.]|uniref:hypothetical protein n=1 Tax=Maridesulfovibrio sp. TaxID=2795000 RepID=UPI002AA93D8A|nr:hypothetical protein [Maridesulfovibrio sp.]
MSVTVDDFYNWAVETFPRFEEEAEDEAPVKTTEKNIEWFAMLCDHLEVDDKITARSLCNKIKKKSAPEKPIYFDIYQVVIYEDVLFYSILPMTPKEWKDWFVDAEADKIVFKTFENYLSRYKKNLPTNPKSIK